MRHTFNRIAGAVGFLTALPVGSQKTESLRGSVVFFPWVGLLLGGLLWLQNLLLGPLLPPSLNALGLVFTGAILTRGLHLDGLADSADGLLSHQSPQRMLEIMRDSRIGTMGTLALMFDVLIRWQALAHCPAAGISQALILPTMLGRAAMGLGMTVFPYARESGMASEFLAEKKKGDFYGLLLTAVLVSVLASGLRGASICALVFFTAFLLLSGAKRRFGGFTGDLLGAVNEIVELICLNLLIFLR